MARICVAISGGIDSLCALLMLKRELADLIALHGLFLPGQKRDLQAHAKIESLCKRLNVPLILPDLTKEFGALVIQPFLDAWQKGLTPNPCVICNRDLKFGLLMDIATKMGAAHLATGHYAQKSGNPYPGPDPCILVKDGANRKDQCYFLARVCGDALNKAIFPLAGLAKDECRKFVADCGYEAPLPNESQDICFMGAEKPQKYLESRLPRKPGPILLVENGEMRQIGTHQGLWRHTEGQRKGLGISWPNPLHVLQKNPEDNSLVVGSKTLIGSRQAWGADPVFHVDPHYWPEDLRIQTRSTQKPIPGMAKFNNGRIAMRFTEDKPVISPGQLAAIYDRSGNLLAAATLMRGEG